jgi:hypothetical protein
MLRGSGSPGSGETRSQGDLGSPLLALAVRPRGWPLSGSRAVTSPLPWVAEPPSLLVTTARLSLIGTYLFQDEV